MRLVCVMLIKVAQRILWRFHVCSSREETGAAAGTRAALFDAFGRSQPSEQARVMINMIAGRFDRVLGVVF